MSRAFFDIVYKIVQNNLFFIKSLFSFLLFRLSYFYSYSLMGAPCWWGPLCTCTCCTCLTPALCQTSERTPYSSLPLVSLSFSISIISHLPRQSPNSATHLPHYRLPQLSNPLMYYLCSLPYCLLPYSSFL